MTLTTLLHFDFIVRALEAGFILGLIAPVIGIFLVVRRYSLLADALAHVSLLGVALALVFQIPVFVGALVTALVAAFGMERLRVSGRVLSESIIALFLSSSLALSVVVMSLSHGLNANLFSYLFGSLTTVTGNDVLILFLLALFVFGFLFFFYRQLFLFAIDEDLARVSGVRVRLLNAVFVALAAVTVAAAMQIVGVLLIGALMVIPVLTAMQWKRSFRMTLVLSVVFSLVSVFFGFILSYVWNVVSGGAIVMVAVGLFLFTILTRAFLVKLPLRRPAGR